MSARFSTIVAVVLTCGFMLSGCGGRNDARPEATHRAATARSIVADARATADSVIDTAGRSQPTADVPTPTTTPRAVSPTAATTPVRNRPTEPGTAEPAVPISAAPRADATRPATVAPPAGRVMLYVNARARGRGGAELREAPSDGSPVQLLIPNGVRVSAVARAVDDGGGQPWYEVRYRGRTGYVAGTMLTPFPPAARRTPTPRPAASPTAAPPESVDTARFFPVYPPKNPLPRAELELLLPSTRRAGPLTLHYRPDTFARADIDHFARDSASAIGRVERLLGARLRGAVDYYLAWAIFPPPDPGLRGYNRSGERVIFQLYDGSGTRLERQYLAAHELTHQIAADSIGAAASTMLSEGLAMYAGQRYLVADGHVSLDGFSRAALDDVRLIPITRLSDGSVRFMGRLPQRYPYDEAGSFVGFLIRTYGLPEFKRVYTSGDYVGVYGKDLSALEAEWRAYLRSDRAAGPYAPDSRRYLDGIEAVQAGYERLFAALETGRPVPLAAYQALDAARIAADRAKYTETNNRLRSFEQSLPR